MATLSDDQTRAYIHKLLAAMRQAGGSNLFISNDFRVNVYVQQQNVAMVLRVSASQNPNFEKRDPPRVLTDVIINKRDLVLAVGGTG